MSYIYRYFIINYLIAKKSGVRYSIFTSLFSIIIDATSIMWNLIHILIPLQELLKLGISLFISLSMVFFIFMKDEKYKYILNTTKELTLNKVIIFVFIKLIIAVLLYNMLLMYLSIVREIF